MQALVIASKESLISENIMNLHDKDLADIKGCITDDVWNEICRQKDYVSQDSTMILFDDRVYSDRDIMGTLNNTDSSMVLCTGLRMYKNSRIYVMDRVFWNGVVEKSVMESLFASNEEKLAKYQERYGGYWRYPGLYDFCYLANPCFPNERFLNEMKDAFGTLVREYPSGMKVNSVLAADYFEIPDEYICVGNGTSELIKSLMEKYIGNVGVIYPTFEEYPHRKNGTELIPFMGLDEEFMCNVDDISDFYKDKNVDAIILVNPDNPTGRFIPKNEIVRLAGICHKQGVRLIVDESFVDFADEENQSLIDYEILKNNPNIIVMKSISKSYGVPGIRLGVIVTGDEEIIASMKKDVAIWNINSFGEFFWQIIGKYRNDYRNAMNDFGKIRKRYLDNLTKNPNLKVYPTQSNYVMCKLINNMKATELATLMLNRYNILIKDLTGKSGLDDGEYIRLSVKSDEENNYVIRVLEEIL